MRSNVVILCLCGHCAGVFYRSSVHRIKRIDPLQIIKEECMYCRIHNGYDYAIKDISKCVRREFSIPGNGIPS